LPEASIEPMPSIGFDPAFGRGFTGLGDLSGIPLRSEGDV
jgi:hypothetical protein